MSSTGVYLNFDGTAERAFDRYRQLFGGDFTAGISRMRDVPLDPGGAAPADDELDRVMHVALTLPGGMTLMGSDVLPSQGMSIRRGNTTTIVIETDTLAEAERLIDELSSNGRDRFGLQQMFWGAWWGTCEDEFGVRWMFSHTPS